MEGDGVKKIVIDVRLSGLRHAGIGRYIQMLVEHMDAHLRQFGNGTLKLERLRSGVRHYTLAEQVLMPFQLRQMQADLVHFPHFNVPMFYLGRFVVTIHDLLWHEQVGDKVTTLPPWLYRIKHLGYRLVLRHAVGRARAIIVPSHWVKERIAKRFPQVRENIFVIYEGVSTRFSAHKILSRKEAALLETYGVAPQKFLVYTGSLYPHKNVSVILDALRQFPQLKLIVACARSVFWRRFADEVKQRGLSSQVALAGFIPDDELVCLYRNALAFVFPSRSEGFGLPGLEAMAAGCPVISSNAGSLPEIYGDAAAYFDPRLESELRREIEKVARNQEYRLQLIRKGKERAKQFSWEKCAAETLDVYKRVIND